MAGGLALRINPAQTLEKYCIQTLLNVPGHQLLTAGIYGYIRNSGHLGVLLLYSGAVLAVQNYISLII